VIRGHRIGEPNRDCEVLEVRGADGGSPYYVRWGDSGKSVEFCFCPACGSTVFWIPEFRKELVAVALGCFADPSSLAPTQSVYEESRLEWVSFDFTWEKVRLP
jgi:hypothetical protein